MKKIIVVVFIAVLFSCTVKEAPEFIGVSNIKVAATTKTYITLNGEALFKNPNDIGGKLKTDEIKVFVNGNQMATIATENFDVPAKKEFTIPLKVNIPTDSIFSNKNIGGLIGSLLSKKIEVKYQGEIKYTIFGFSQSYTIDETENVKIK